MQEIISRYEYLMRQHREYVEEHQQEREMMQGWKQSQQQYKANIDQLQNILVSSHLHPSVYARSRSDPPRRIATPSSWSSSTGTA